jgi:hypothetical protein
LLEKIGIKEEDFIIKNNIKIIKLGGFDTPFFYAKKNFFKGVKVGV